MAKSAAKGSSASDSAADLPTRPLPRSMVLSYAGLAALATMALLPLAFAAHTIPYFDFDLAITRAVQSINASWFDLLMHLVGLPGYPPQVYVLVLAIVLILWTRGLRWEATAQVFAIVGIGVVGLVVKIPVDRPRPSPNLVHVANPGLDGGKMSFPAGHVESYVAILGFLFFLAWMARRHSWLGVLELIVFGGMIALIGLSRIYVGEHWPSDVLGGYLLGSAWLALTILFYNWGKPRFFAQT
jgi:undecaprenyl-diphosphatase